jgi:peptide chain release factor subunit 1
MSLSDVSRQIERLSRIKPGKHPVVSCYLKLEPRDRSRGKYLIKLKNRTKAVLERLPALGFGRADQAAVARDLARIQTELSRPGSLPSTRGVAIFASSGMKLYERVDVPFVYRSRLVVDRTPLVRELLAAEDEVGRLLTVVLDRKSARIFQVTAFGAREVADIRGDATRGGRFRSDRRDAPGQGERSYHNRLRNEKQRHLDRIASTLFGLDRTSAIHGLVLAGIGTEAAALEPFLHPYLRDRVLGVARLNPQEVTPRTVHLATLDVRAAVEESVEARLVAEMHDALGAGWAVNGVRDTLHALGRGQLRSLLVASDADVPGVRSAATGRLGLTERDLRGDGEVVPVCDVIDDAVEEALRQGIPVEVIHAPAAASRVDGIAGMLRFRS